MNQEHHNNPDHTPIHPTPAQPPNHGLPADLLGIAGMLDTLGDRERGRMPASLADRVFAASRTTLNTGPAAGTVSLLKEDRDAVMAGVPADLEDNIFHASRSFLGRTAVESAPLRLAGTQAAPHRASNAIKRGVLLRSRGALRLAAVVAIAGGALAAYFALQTGPTDPIGPTDGIASTPDGADAPTVADAVETALDGLETVLAADQFDRLMADADSIEGALKTGMIDENEFVEKGAL